MIFVGDTIKTTWLDSLLQNNRKKSAKTGEKLCISKKNQTWASETGATFGSAVVSRNLKGAFSASANVKDFHNAGNEKNLGNLLKVRVRQFDFFDGVEVWFSFGKFLKVSERPILSFYPSAPLEAFNRIEKIGKEI